MDPAEAATLAATDISHHWHPYTDMSTYADEQLLVVRGEGPWVFDARGNAYLDAISGLWNVNLGHGRREVIAAVADQLAVLAYQPLNGRSHPSAARLAGVLARLCPGELDRVFFASGGAEAVETAIKIVRAYWRHLGQPRRTSVIGLANGWHGCTLGALSAGGVAAEKAPFRPMAGGFVQFVPPEGAVAGEAEPGAVAAGLERVLAGLDPGAVAAFLGEPVQGLAGMIAPVPAFWREIRDVCRRHEILLIADEVAMGFGRTGRMFSFEHYDLEPDLVTCAKGITAGYLPLAAVIVSARVFAPFAQPGRTFPHGYTWGGHPAACAAALAAIDIIERERLCERAAQLGARMRQELADGLAGCSLVSQVRGLGLALAVQLARRRPAEAVAGLACRRLRERGVLARPVGGGDTLPLLPPLTLPDDLATDLVVKYVEVIRELDRELAGSGPTRSRKRQTQLEVR